MARLSDQEQEFSALLEDNIETLLGRKNLQKGKLIDFVLAYQPSKLSSIKMKYREVYEEKLLESGLLLNYQKESESKDGITAFVKIRIPQHVLCQVAERNRLHVPIQESDIPKPKKYSFLEHSLNRCAKFCCRERNPLKMKKGVRPPKHKMYFTTEFETERSDEFLIESGETQLFTDLQRIRIVWEIMQKTVVESRDVDRRISGHKYKDYASLSFLLNNGVYVATYPLHDSDVENTAYYPQPVPGQMRHWLSEFWARIGRWSTHQPLHQIRAYFGEKVAMYFAWLGFYTMMLLPLSLIGLLCFLYSYGTIHSDEPLKDVCGGRKIGNRTICRQGSSMIPQCAAINCKFTNLSDYCEEAVVNASVESAVTIPYAFITCVWSVVVLEMLKRRQARLACEWGTIGLSREYEPPRSQYQAVATKTFRHPVTRELEPYIPRRSQCVRFMRSLVAVTFFVCIVIAVVFAIIAYRAFMVIKYYNIPYLRDHPLIRVSGGSSTFTSFTASLISVICMVILEKVYWKVAYFLTENEYPRTNKIFEDSFTIKIYVFQFVNYYGTLFYMAFVQGLEYLAPPHQFSRTRDHQYSAYCSPIGCTFTVTIQLCMILLVKQMLFNLIEVATPYYSNMKLMTATTRHEKDFYLPEMSHLGLLNEYLEMALQFGTVVMFGAIFPLAPLFALFNNILEVRVDAYKLLSVRRVVPQRVANIGTWYKILEVICKIGILTNACLIAFTTNLIDRLYYEALPNTQKPGNETLVGFVDFTLSVFNTSDWENRTLALNEEDGGNLIQECYYKGHYSKSAEGKYNIDRNGLWILASKVSFVLFFENVMWWIHSLLRYFVANESKFVKLHVLRNHYVAKSWWEKGQPPGPIGGPSFRKRTLNADMDLSFDLMTLRKRSFSF